MKFIEEVCMRGSNMDIQNPVMNFMDGKEFVMSYSLNLNGVMKGLKGLWPVDNFR